MAVNGSPIRLVDRSRDHKQNRTSEGVFTPQPALVGYPWAFPVRWLCLLGDAKRRRIETKRPRFRFAFPGEPVFESDDRRSEVFASMAAMAAMKTCEKYGKSSIPKRRSRNGTNKGSCPGLLCTALTTAPTRHTGTSVAASSVFGPRLRLPARFNRLTRCRPGLVHICGLGVPILGFRGGRRPQPKR